MDPDSDIFVGSTSSFISIEIPVKSIEIDLCYYYIFCNITCEIFNEFLIRSDPVFLGDSIRILLFLGGLIQILFCSNLRYSSKYLKYFYCNLVKTSIKK